MTKGDPKHNGRVCQFIKPDGEHCQARPMHGKDFCYFHDPDRADARREASRAGGLKARPKSLPENTPDVDLSDVASVIGLLSRTINQTLRGEVDPRIANAVGYLSSMILRAKEESEIAERLERLEEVLKEGKGIQR